MKTPVFKFSQSGHKDTGFTVLPNPSIVTWKQEAKHSAVGLVLEDSGADLLRAMEGLAWETKVC